MSFQSEEFPSNIKVGDTISFGAYEQDGEESNGKEKIQWIVLDKSGSSILLISKYAVDCKPFNEEFEDITWEKCTLRAWLNNDFFNTAFTTEENRKIKTTFVVNEDNPDSGTKGGNDTNDKIFLLSISEAKRYFKDDDYDYGWDSGYSAARGCKPTTYAIKRGAWYYVFPENYGEIEEFRKFEGNCFWWLRSPGDEPNQPAYVEYSGGVSDCFLEIYYDEVAVRPALWINLDS